jgi:hypothetical protein
MNENEAERREPGCEVGALTAHDLGRLVRLVHDGVLIVGRLSRVAHDSPMAKDYPARTLLSIRGDDSWRWCKSLHSDLWIQFPEEQNGSVPA